MKKTDKLFDFIAASKETDFDLLGEELDRRFGETCAPLVLDSSGFTRTTKVLGPAFFLSIICRMREVCFEVAKSFRATGSRAEADNFYAEFRKVDDAVGAALAIHRRFEDDPIPLLNDRDRFAVGIGIGFGRVLRSEHEGVYGSEMNSASKLGEDAAQPGETLLTESAFLALSHPESFEVKNSVMTLSGVQMLIFSLKPKAE